MKAWKVEGRANYLLSFESHTLALQNFSFYKIYPSFFYVYWNLNFYDFHHFHWPFVWAPHKAIMIDSRRIEQKNHPTV